MPQKLTTYFQSVADVLDQKRKVTDVFPNAVDKGQAREGIFKGFLEAHLPQRCKVIFGGYIFDSSGNESSQIDLIVINDLTLQFNQLQESNSKSFAAIEGCYAAISVKSQLDKNALEDSLKGFSTIPKMPDLKVNPSFKSDIPKQIPLRIIFAFSGLESNTIKSHLEEFYKNNSTPENEQVKFVIVNNKYIIIRTVKETVTNKGVTIPKNTFFVAEPTKYVGAYTLHFLITDLQKVSNISSHMILNFGNYLDSTLVDYS